VRMLESGPAAGVLMSARHSLDLKLPQILSFDMGGTTAKGCMIRDHAPLKRYEFEVARVHEFKRGSGLPVKIPVLDMIEIGSGGGSLAQIDDRGVLGVGPRSAGADPGPACYGRGGRRPTLTDANLVLGYLDSSSFLGGTMALDHAAAVVAIESDVARPDEPTSRRPRGAFTKSSTRTSPRRSACMRPSAASTIAAAAWSYSAAPGPSTVRVLPASCESPESSVPAARA